MALDSPKLLICGPGRYLEIVDANKPSQRTQFETSLESVQVVKELNGMIACGGSHGMIEILQKGVTGLILFRN